VANHDVILAVLSLHEPYWRGGAGAISSESQKVLADKIRNYTRNKGHEIKVWNAINMIAGWSDPVVESQADLAGIWRHCFGGAEGTCEQAKQRIRNDRTYINQRGWDMELAFAVQTFGMTEYAYRMPNYQELKEFTCDIIAEDNLDTIFYYSWRNPAGYSDVLYNHPELHGVIKDVYDECIQGLAPVPTPTPTPPVTPTPTPTPTSSPSPSPTLSPTPTPGQIRGDFNGDGEVDLLDFEIFRDIYVERL